MDERPFRLLLELLRWQLFVCHLINEVDGASACRTVGSSLSKPRAPMIIEFLMYFFGPCFHGPLYFTLGLTPGDGITLVVHFFTPAKSQFQFRDTTFNI